MASVGGYPGGSDRACCWYRTRSSITRWGRKEHLRESADASGSLISTSTEPRCDGSRASTSAALGCGCGCRRWWRVCDHAGSEAETSAEIARIERWRRCGRDDRDARSRALARELDVFMRRSTWSPTMPRARAEKAISFERIEASLQGVDGACKAGARPALQAMIRQVLRAGNPKLMRRAAGRAFDTPACMHSSTT